MALWSRILGSAILLVLATVVFGGARADANDRAVSVATARDVLAREFSVSGTVDCGRRSGLRCAVDPPFLLSIWTEDISGSRERISVDVSWIVRQLDGYDQDDLICLNVQVTGDGTLQAVGTWTPCGPPEPTKRPSDEKEQKTADEPTPTPTATPAPTQTVAPSATVTRTATPTFTITPISTPTPIINLSLTKTGVRGPFTGTGYLTTWTITVTNAGPNIAHNVVVIDRPTEGLTTVTTAVVSQGTYNTATNRWTIGTIGVGEQKTAEITFGPSFGDPVTFNWVNEAEVESADETDSNSTPNNNNPVEDDQDRETMEVPL